MTMSARKAKRRIVDMMASTVVVELRWMQGDEEGRRILAWIARNQGRTVNALRKALKETFL